MKKIKVDKVILYYMDRVDPDRNLYRFYVYKDMASEIEYFCTEETGNMTIPIGEGKYIEIVPREIVKIPVRGYRKLTGIWNRETCNGKVMGEHYYNKFVHEFNGNILKMISYFRGSEKEGQVFCDMITERIEKYEKRMSYDKGKLNN